MQNRTSLIEFNNVGYFYDGRNEVLSDISFSIKQGDFIGLKGGNGEGKTTAVKILLDIIKPVSGKVINNMGSTSSISYVPQNISEGREKFPANVLEIVSLGTYRRRKNPFLPSIFSKKEAREALELMEMSEFENRLISQLSGGQRQKVMIAKALASKPKLLILDEPDSGIDEESSHNLYKLMKNLNEKEGISILVISHNIEILEKYTKKVWTLKNGVLEGEGLKC